MGEINKKKASDVERISSHRRDMSDTYSFVRMNKRASVFYFIFFYFMLSSGGGTPFVSRTVAAQLH